MDIGAFTLESNTRPLQTGQWVTDRELAALLGLHPQTLRTWRWRDRREGRTAGNYHGGVVYRRFGAAVRYLITADLVGEKVSSAQAGGSQP